MVMSRPSKVTGRRAEVQAEGGAVVEEGEDWMSSIPCGDGYVDWRVLERRKQGRHSFMIDIGEGRSVGRSLRRQR